MRTLVYDVEVTHLKANLGTCLVVSFGEVGPDGRITKMHTNDIHEAGGERNLLRWTRKMYATGDIIIGFNQLAFDRHWLDGALTRYNLPLLPKRIQLDVYQIAKGKYALHSTSLANLADFLRLGEAKDKPSIHEWRDANILDKKSVKRLRERCESDVRITMECLNKMKPLLFESKGR